MRRAQNEVLPCLKRGDALRLFLRVAAPQNEHTWFCAFGHRTHRGICYSFPAALLVRTGLSRFDR